jgi:hypothetical protein
MIMLQADLKQYQFERKEDTPLSADHPLTSKDHWLEKLASIVTNVDGAQGLNDSAQWQNLYSPIINIICNKKQWQLQWPQR